ncbi:gas vesicle protein [Thermomonospora amylolytica]|uniref:gas vesicle protein n=1 Tax=Thermomonospora amylolytica TaxID=1411117 RepID=UPI000E6BCA90|nr:gas vesicle protein [Thermomonospora amylolytica]
MSQVEWAGPAASARSSARSSEGRYQPANLADLLERILDKGIVIVGDIRVNLLDIELLTIKIRLLVASVERAKEMGIDWWEHDPAISSKARREAERERRDVLEENRMLRERLAALEARLSSPPEVEAAGDGASRRTGAKSTTRTGAKTSAKSSAKTDAETTAKTGGTERRTAADSAGEEDADE